MALIQKTFLVTDAQNKALNAHVDNLSEYLLGLIAADFQRRDLSFPMDKPKHGGNHQPGHSESRTCENCGKTFMAQDTDNGDSLLYCSEKCRRSAQNKRNYERRKAKSREV